MAEPAKPTVEDFARYQENARGFVYWTGEVKRDNCPLGREWCAVAKGWSTGGWDDCPSFMGGRQKEPDGPIRFCCFTLLQKDTRHD